MHKLELSFARAWKKRRFPEGPKRLLLALSGGIDSMVLAHLLLRAGKPFAVAHCNFGLRGAASDGDEAYVLRWCADNDIEAHTIRFDMRAIEESIQSAARSRRYAWFDELLQKPGYNAVCTAHNANDVAETMLINLARGTGLAGLHGIPTRRGKIIRPLLFATRAEIAAYAEAMNIKWREDASNATTAYLRNAVRHEVLPKLEALFPGAALHMAETARRIAGAEHFYSATIRRRLDKMSELRGRDEYLPVKLWRASEGLENLAYEFFIRYGFTAGQMGDIIDLLDAESGRSVSSRLFRVIRHRDFLVISPKEEREAGLHYIAAAPSTLHTPWGTFECSWAETSEQLDSGQQVAMLDGDNIVFPLLLRSRHEGDYFYPLGMGGKKKKLKRFLIDQKVPVHEKERIPILESEKKILWVAGYRIDERFKVRPSTQKILKVVFTPV